MSDDKVCTQKMLYSVPNKSFVDPGPLLCLPDSRIVLPHPVHVEQVTSRTVERVEAGSGLLPMDRSVTGSKLQREGWDGERRL
jgi:hypothetical protein